MNLFTLRLWTLFGFKLLSKLQVLYQINLVALLLYILLHLNCYLLNLEQKSIRKHFIIKSVFFLCRLANVCTLTTFFFKSSCLSVQFKFKFKFKFKLCCFCFNCFNFNMLDSFLPEKIFNFSAMHTLTAICQILG